MVEFNVSWIHAISESQVFNVNSYCCFRLSAFQWLSGAKVPGHFWPNLTSTSPFSFIWALTFSRFLQSERNPCMFVWPVSVHVLERLGLNDIHGQQKSPIIPSLPHSRSFLWCHKSAWKTLPLVCNCHFGIGRSCWTMFFCSATVFEANDFLGNWSTRYWLAIAPWAWTWAITLHYFRNSVQID